MTYHAYRVQVTVPNANGLPEDAIVNTWHFYNPNGVTTAADATEIETQIDSFYTAWVANIASPAYTWNVANLKITSFLDDVPRLPFVDKTISFGSGTTNFVELPTEVACCLSMEGVRESGANMRRRRGRVYLGPFALNAPADMPFAPSAVYNDVTVAANTAFFTTPAAGVAHLAVYSPYTHFNVPVGERMNAGALIGDGPNRVELAQPRTEDPNKLLDSFHGVVRMWADNAWDTQRRRGRKATTRLIVNEA